MSTTATTWIGWWRRPGQQWVKVVEAATEDQARERLRLEVGASGYRLIDTWCGPANECPHGPRAVAGERRSR